MATIINADTSDGLKLTSDTSGEIQFQSGGVTKMTVGSSGVSGIPTYAGTKNRIINGSFDIWQRGSSVASSSSTITYTVDRFASRPNSSTDTTVSRSTDAPDGFSYSALVTRDSGQTGTLTRFQTALETVNMASLRGQTVTLSFYAKADSGFTTASSSLPVVLYVGNGTERLRAITSYDNQTTPISSNVTLTTSWQRFTITSTALPSDLSQLTVAFEPSWVGTAPANDGFYITGVQLETGTTATDFENLQYGTQLQLCQRYYARFNSTSTYTAFGSGMAYTTTAGQFSIKFPTTMRAAPTLNGATLAFMDGLVGRAVISIATNFFGTDSGMFQCGSTGLTQFRPYLLTGNNSTSAYIDLTAEL